MRKEIYTKDEAAELELSMKKHISSCVSLGFAAAVLCGINCLLANLACPQGFKILNIGLSAAAGWTMIHWILDCIVPLQNRKNYVFRLLAAKRQVFIGTVTEVGARTTLAKDISAYEIQVEAENGTVLLYWDCEKGKPDFGCRKVRFESVQRRIAAYEVME